MAEELKNNENVTTNEEKKDETPKKENIFKRSINWVKAHKKATIGIGVGALTAAGLIAKLVVGNGDDPTVEIPAPEDVTTVINQFPTEGTDE